MFLAVWLVYAADRLLDTQHPAYPLQPRHLFPRAHLPTFGLAMLFASAALATLLPTLPVRLLAAYLVLAALLLVWFALIHLTRLRLPKEFAPGLFFAAAVFLPVPHAVFPALLFAALCTLNCLYIHRWEHDPAPARRVPHPHDSPIVVRVGLSRRLTAPAQSQPAQPDPNPHPATTFALSHLPTLTLAAALLPLARPCPIPIAVSLSAIALLALDRHRHHIAPTHLRAAADLALLTPILILPFLP